MSGHREETWSVCGSCNPYLLWYGYGIPVEGVEVPEDHERVVDSALEEFEDGGYVELILRDNTSEFSRSMCDSCGGSQGGPRYTWELIRGD